jgi:Spy/CpxP family protein refolding chaperone
MKWSNIPIRFRGPSTAMVGVVLALGLMTLVTPLEARGRDQDQGFKQELFAKVVFAPDLVMRHQGEIGLSEDQKQSLIAELQATQSDLVPVQLEISEAGESLARMLGPTTVDEAEALAAAERVMQLETQIKMIHLRLVIRVKNLLSVEQQEMLRQIQERT